MDNSTIIAVFSILSTLTIGILACSINHTHLKSSRKSDRLRLLHQYQSEKDILVYGVTHREISNSVHFLKSVATKGLTNESNLVWDGPFTIEHFSALYFNAFKWYKKFKSLSPTKGKEDMQKTTEFSVNESRSFVRDVWYHLLSLNLKYTRVKNVKNIPFLENTELKDLSRRYVRFCRFTRPFDFVMGCLTAWCIKRKL
eukprot:NODE_580_length_6469_cov_0.200628.p3 type:complete len:199 gc:universal NODE_580_length_6469_cov_0.200628:1216-620(-)